MARALFGVFGADRSRRPPAWILATLVVGLLLSFACFAIVRRWEKLDEAKRAADTVREQIENLRVSMFRSIEVLNSISSLYAIGGRIEREQFSSFVRQALSRQPELLALSWNPIISAETRDIFEREAHVSIRELGRDGELVPAAARETFVPVGYIEPVEGNRAAVGYDLSSDALRREALERARDSGKAIGTAPIRLAQGPKERAGFLVILPIFKKVPPQDIEERRRQLAGYAVAVFRVGNLVSEVFAELRKKGIDAELRDLSARQGLVYSNVGKGLQHFERAELEFAEHRWTIFYAPIPAFLGTREQFQSWLVLLCGLGFTGMATAYLWAVSLRSMEVAKANAALQMEVVERKRAEAAAAAANKAKSDFLANMSHEIRTPLNAILGYAQLMQRDVHLMSEQKDSIFGIRSSGGHLLGLINEVLDLSKIEAGRMELNLIDFDLQCSLNSILATMRPLCAQKRVGLRVAIQDGGRCVLRGDEGKLRQVIINLLGNAVKFTVVGEVFLGVSALKDGMWRFEVMDTGLGIPDEERAHIFEPFHQGKGAQHQGGTGLGLAIARRQVEVMGGKLEFESERGIGTRFFFTVCLPDASGSEVQIEAAVPESADGEEPLDPGPIDLSEALCSRLMIAAELHSATALKSCLRELREHGPDASRLADRIRHLMRSYDMEGIQRLLIQAARPARKGASHGTDGR